MKIVKGRPSAYETSTDESLQNKKQTLLGDEPQVSFAKTVKLQKRQFSCKAVRQLTKLKWKALLVFLTKLSWTKRWTKTVLEEEKLIVHTFYIKITNVVILLSCVLVLCASSRQCINNPAIHIYKLIQYHKPLKTLAWFKITGLLSIFPRLKVSLLCFYNFIQTVYYDL